MLYWLLLCSFVVVFVFTCTMQVYMRRRLAQSLSIFDQPLEGTFGTGRADDTADDADDADDTAEKKLSIAEVTEQMKQNL